MMIYESEHLGVIDFSFFFLLYSFFNKTNLSLLHPNLQYRRRENLDLQYK